LKTSDSKGLRNRLTYVGESVSREDGVAKATGTARFVHDLSLPGMLHAATLKSPYARARILKIDIRAARALSGVRAVLTGDDLDFLLGLYMQDKPILARGQVRYQGEPIAAVAADTLEIARSACALIEVDYEPQIPVLDPRVAMIPVTSLVHEDLHTYHYMKGVFAPKPHSNIAHHQKIRVGDVDRGLEESDLVMKESFYNPPVPHVPMETHAVIAQALPDDHIEVHTSAQSPYTVRNILCHSFNLPHSNVRVHVPYIGGGFGGKAGIHLEPLAYCLSKAAGGRAVKLVATREEEFGTLPSRQGLHTEITIGATSDGKIKAFKATYTWDAGAYADYGVNIGRAAAYSGAGPYRVPNCRIDSYVVYTNKVFGTAYRGFGHLEVMWGVERAIDITAHRLGMGPYEFRVKNLLKEGDKTITGETFTSGHGRPDKCLEAVADAIGWGKESAPSGPHKVCGKGIASLHKAPAMPTSTSCSAIIKLNEDASADILISGVDMGQGTYTVLRQIAAEELKLPIEKVQMTWDCDTAFSPYDWQTVASRFTFMGGNAVIEAARDCLRQIKQVAATALKISPERIVCHDGKAFVIGEEERAIPYEKLVLGYTFENGNSIGGPVIGHGCYIAKGLTNLDLETGQGLPALYWTYGAHGVEIEVDKDTGEIEILNIVTAIDAGKVLNPKLCKGQVVGGVLQGLGSTLFEGLIFSEEGRLLNPSFTDHKIPTMKDIPLATKQIFIETAQPDGPYGARGIAEHPMISVPSVVGNALYDALGINFTELPLTKERIYLAMEEGRKSR